MKTFKTVVFKIINCFMPFDNYYNLKVQRLKMAETWMFKAHYILSKRNMDTVIFKRKINTFSLLAC